ncbi:MAG: VWA domain-containing protein [Gemmatimonadales bacterium]
MSALRRIAVLFIGLLGTGQPVAAQDAPELLLVRCAEGIALPCLTTVVDLAPSAAIRVNAMEGADSSWQVRFGRDSAAPGFGRRTVALRPRPARVLLLVDVSGSMRNLGIGVAKLVIKDNLLRPLEAMGGEQVRVAVAPFGSRSVEARIEGVPFVAPGDAVAQVEALPDPDRENTGLYSAVRAGIRRLDSEMAGLEGDATALLIVLTDGDNDVGGSEDDPGLLDGPAGLAAAAEAVGRSAAFTAIVGVGTRVDPRPLRVLAGERGRSSVVPLDAYRLAEPLTAAREMLASGWEVVFRVARGGREELGRGWARAAIEHRSGALELPLAVWRPPVVALPAYSGIATPGLVPAGLIEAAVGGRFLDRRIPLVLFALVLIGLLWLVVPRLLWPPIVPAAAPGAAPKKKAPKVVGGLRTDVQEAPPRRPTDVTASGARRSKT